MNAELCSFARRDTKIQFLLVLIVFAAVYFGICLPLFQLISKRGRGRKFIILLGMAWNLTDAEQRWEVMMSFLSLCVSSRYGDVSVGSSNPVSGG